MRLLLSLVMVVLVLPLPAPAEESVQPIRVGSKTFAESRILTEIMAQLIEKRTDLPVERKMGLSGTMVAHSAMLTGELDIYPEYTGTGVVTILKLEERFNDPLRTYLVARRQFRKRFGIEWLQPFGFNNTYALAVREETAKKYHLSRVSDLKAVEDKLRLGVSHEFLSRPDGFPGLSKAYGFNFAHARGMEHGLAYQAIAEGTIDLIDAFSTDGELVRYKLTTLEDDRKFFPPYHAAPVVRAEVLSRHPKLRSLLSELGWRLPDSRMQQLNYLVQEEKLAVAEVARRFLEEEGLVETSRSPGQQRSAARSDSFVGLLLQRSDETLELITEHLWLTGVSLGLAILVGIPIGIVITRWEAASQPVLGAAGIVQTIPSIALLAFMIPIPGLGLGARSAILALFLYALLPIVRNTYTGIREVEAGLIEAARGMGLRDRQILTLVELPLATRTIMAGVRTSAVINVGVATLAAFIGAGGLGDPIVTGLQLNDTSLVLCGAVPAALLAVVVDQGLGLLENLLAPRGTA